MASSPSPPPSYRLSRGFRRASTIALVLIIIFVLSAVYSFAQFARSVSASEQHSFALESNNTAEFDLTLNLTNPGFYPIAGFQVHSEIMLQNGSFLSQATSPATTLNAGSAGSIPLQFLIPLDAAGAASSLAVDDQSLHLLSWGNATYAYLVPVSFEISNNFSWGAPFEGLNVTVGTPTAAPNGTVSADVSVAYSNDASFPELGTFEANLRSPSLTVCGEASYSVDTPAQQMFEETTTVYFAPGCSPSGGTVVAEFVGPTFTLVLPSEAIPS
ncbi:MAG: hypothetical protein WB778_06450 [Thermoplasmata archaeon]